MKHILKTLLLIAIATVLTSCTTKPIDTTDPTSTVSGFMSAIKSYDFETISGYLTDIPNSKNQGLLIDIYTDENYVSLYKETGKTTTYSIDSVEETEIGAIVTVNIKCHDLKKGYSAALLSLAAQVMEDEKLMQEMLDKSKDVTHYIPQTIQELIEQGSIATEEQQLKITLVKNQDQTFRVSLNDSAKTLITCGISDAIAGITGNLNQ